MKFDSLKCLVFSLLVVFSAAAFPPTAAPKSPSPSADDAQAFLGRWDLTLKSANQEYPSWLELSEDNGQLKAQFVSRWGNARPLPKAEISAGVLTFVSPKADEERKEDMVFQGHLSGTTLTGTTTGPDGDTWTWTGQRAPSLKRTGSPKWGKPVELFNGKDLTGWHFSSQNSAHPWTVVDGALTSPGHGPEIIYDSKFEDFKLHVEFNCGSNANSGVYLRGRYEVQIEDDSIQEPPSHHTGGVYGFIAPSPEMPRKAGEWQTFDITLIGRTITVVQNGKTIIDNQEIPGITGGALDSNEGLPGPIYLQGTENGHAAFRKITLTPALSSK